MTIEKQKLPAGWKWLEFEKAVQRIPYNLKKFKANECSRTGNYPVVDQGQNTHVGYTDDEYAVYKKPLPIIIFGDHTKISKYIEYPFAVGADGVVILKPNDGIDTKYFYYWLSIVQIQELGYSRHYSVLKKLSIPLPPLPEQKRIVRILNDQLAAVEKARQAAQEQLDAANALPGSYIRDSLSNGSVRRCELAACLDEIKHGIGSLWSDYPLYGATREGIAPAKEGVGKCPERYKPVEELTVFYNPMRILLGSIAFVDEGDAPGITSPDYVVLKGKDKILHSRWFYYWFRSSHGIRLIHSLSRGAVRERILFNRLSKGQIDLPDWKTQLKTANALKSIDGLKKKIAEQIETINAAAPLLLKRAFQGEL